MRCLQRYKVVVGEWGGGVFVPYVSRGTLKAIKAMLQISKVGRSSYCSNDLGPVMVSHTTNKAGIWWGKQFFKPVSNSIEVSRLLF